ncbi:hypothetical protein [Hyphococcus sp. DH-69]|uniref:YkvI family membrane protein n=1 Tax=Hyphococcus formosus TaxID=3143534 RepID=UPI00398B803C
MKRVFQIYLLPGLVFQSVLIGGGYGTGREIVEFFLSHGPIGGLLGMAVTIAVWCFLLAIAFDCARSAKAYDYRSFFRYLIGPFWRLFEVAYLLLALLVIAVVGSASGEIINDNFGLPPIVGTIGLLAGVGVLAFLGSSIIERVLSFWSLLLYVMYAVLLIWVMFGHGQAISDHFDDGAVTGDWGGDGLRYAAYNFVVLAPLLFALRHIETRGQAITAGILASVIGMVPAIFLFIAMLAGYPDIIDAAVPVTELLRLVQSPMFFIFFQIILFGTFVETGTGLVHSINERIASSLAERGRLLPKMWRFLIAVGILTTAVFLADAFGVISLIAKGYMAMSYLFLAVVVFPLATVGAYKVLRSK